MNRDIRMAKILNGKVTFLVENLKGNKVIGNESVMLRPKMLNVNTYSKSCTELDFSLSFLKQVVVAWCTISEAE